MRRWSHIPKSEMCLIGDTMFDVNGAKELGIFCIAVSYGFGDVEEFQNAPESVCRILPAWKMPCQSGIPVLLCTDTLLHTRI